MWDKQMILFLFLVDDLEIVKEQISVAMREENENYIKITHLIGILILLGKATCNKIPDLDVAESAYLSSYEIYDYLFSPSSNLLQKKKFLYIAYFIIAYFN